ncbi:orotidine-5'-phosphate decarboxylase [Helicobacter anatolicus]|uniref:orotidine-5'-phosphate decarboxylase n=1 Tax=Helicobacter anatolicus TaxID=2905874 RepID=UPI001E51C3B4|nr:orotidine-5'-phosphate decarboxylase [Helicobacter anatolicus]MCE3039924.1 orotidine-5'-phosphate decarboxylase [Helicobacter anatolicus]
MELCLALDLSTKEQNLALLNMLKNFPKLWIKVGLRSFIRDGIPFLESIKTINPDFKIFLDLKLYDIPNTMADAAFECANLGVDMITIHTSSGKNAMQTIMERLTPLKKRPLVLGVTALTSFSNEDFQTIYHKNIQDQAINLATLAYQSALDGIVCSVFESLEIKKHTTNSFITLTPGIRPFNENNDDQKRVGTILDAFKNKSDFIVIGRPIYKHDSPKSVVENIYKEIEKCKS